MGSIGAMKARSYSKDRYFQEGDLHMQKLVLEGIEGRVAYKAAGEPHLSDGRRATLGDGLRRPAGHPVPDTRFMRITAAGPREPPARHRHHPRGTELPLE